MLCERIYYPGKEEVYLDTYILNSGLKLGQNMARPAVVICPGGGYIYLSPREAEPVALAYASKGIHAFVLNYSVGFEAKGFQPLKEMDWALQTIRQHAKEWKVDSDKILTCGFSAGGHLALASGLLGEEKPNGMILGYPATDIAGGGDMMMAFLGDKDAKPEDMKWTSLSKQVTKEAPPLYMFVTGEDRMIKKMTLNLVSAYEEQELLYEYHIFQKGPHGYSLANAAAADGSSQVLNAHVAKWLDMSVEWIFEVFGELEHKDVSTSRIMEELKKLGIEIPQMPAKELDNA